jgi:hypothetical protein
MNACIIAPGGLPFWLSARLMIPADLTTNRTLGAGKGARAVANPSLGIAELDVIYFGLWDEERPAHGAAWRSGRQRANLVR